MARRVIDPSELDPVGASAQGRRTVNPSELDPLQSAPSMPVAAPESPGPDFSMAGIAEAAKRSAVNNLQGWSLNTAHRFAPHIFAAVDEGREMLNATSPASYGDRVAQHRKEWLSRVDPSMAAAAGLPVAMSGGGFNTLMGMLSSGALATAGSLDQRGKDVLADPSAQGEMAVSTGLTLLPPAVGGLWRGGRWLAGQSGLDRLGSTLVNLSRGGYVRPTPEAARMAAEGVDLTLGQMNPSSALGRFEEIAAGNAKGGVMSKMRDQAASDIRDVVIAKAAMPGAPLPTRGAPIAQQLDELKAGYTAAYDNAIKGERIRPDLYIGSGRWKGFFTDETLKGAAKTKGAFEVAVNTPDASPTVKARALAKLKDLAARRSLVPRKSGEAVGTVDAKAVQELRSDIRALKRQYGNGTGDEAPQFEEIYRRAEEFTTELLEGQLPAEKATLLREADTNYRNLLAIEEAATGKISHRDQGAFTPEKVLDAIWAKGGATPALEGAARDARAVLNPNFTKTGMLPGALESLVQAKWVGPLWANAVNTSPALKQHALGQGGPAWLRAPAAAADALGAAASGIPDAPQSATTLRALFQMLNERPERDFRSALAERE